MRRARKLLTIILILLLIMQVNYEPAKAEALEDHTHLEETSNIEEISNIEEVNNVNEGTENIIEENAPGSPVDTQDTGIATANSSGITVLNSMTEEETQVAKEMIPDFTSDNYFDEMCSNVLSDLEYEEFEADMLSGAFIPTKAIYTIDDVREYLYIKYNGEAKFNELIEEDEDISHISNKNNVESLLSAQGNEPGYIDATSFGPDNPEFQDCRAKNVGVYSSAPISGLRQYTGYDDTLQMYVYVSRILVVRESDEIFVDTLIENAPVTVAGIAGILSWPPNAVAWALWSISAIDTLQTTSNLLKPIYFKIPTEYSMIRVIEGSATDNTYTLGQIEMPQLSVHSLITLKVDTYTPSGFIASTHWQEDVYDFGHGVYGEQTYANFAAAYYLEQCNTYGYWPHGANNWGGLYNGYLFPEHQCLYSDIAKYTDYAHIKKCVNGLSACDVMEAHNYSSNCDDICNDCDFNRASSSAHNYITKYTTDKHWKECSDCGDKINEGTHTFNNLLNNKCVLEGCLITHTHQEVLQWTVDGLNHYKKCNDSRCSYHFNEDVHKYDNSCDTTCNVCQATRSITHSYDNACDATCNVCQATRSITHTYSNTCDTTCNVCQATRSITHTYSNSCDTSCNICQATRSITHTLEGVWVTVGSSSMCMRVEVKCTVCGYNTGQIPTSDSSHNFSGNNCIDCGYQCLHTYDNACDTTCNKCQASRSTTHTYDNACDTTCNVCQATRSTTHTYDNACDTTCNICKATRSVTHSYSNACDTTCNICEATRSVTHSYSNECDTSCNICWYTRTTTHTLSGVWVVVGTSSMCRRVEVKCSVCGYNTGQVPTSDSSHSFSGTTCLDCGYRCSHSYDNACDTSCNICQATRSTTHTYSNACDTSCNTCQATRSITHSYSNSCDTSCNVCEATRSVTHSYSNACDTSCNICWYTRTTTHTLSGVWVVVGTSSMCKRVEVKCSVCGYNTGQVPTSDSTHNYSGGYCLDCGYKK